MARAHPPATIEAAAEALRGHADAFKALGVEALILFGSLARGDAHSGSDADVMVETAGGRTLRYAEFIAIGDLLEDILLRDVDLVTATGASEPFARAVRESGVRIAL